MASGRGKKLTRKQKEILASWDMDPQHYLLVKETEFFLTVKNKASGDIRRVDNHKNLAKK